MIYWQLFLAFFIPNIVGYGGGPAIIPLIENEVVGHYGWMTHQAFAETLALGNALPSPIATKMAGYIGYDVAGAGGAIVAVLATVGPSLLLMLAALGTLYRYRDSIKVKSMSQWVRPVVMVLMAYLTVSFLREGMATSGLLHTAIIAAVAAFLLLRTKVHPALVVCFGLAYGALLLG
ncbi:chromate transporter [Halomonas denitrificans]|uniref:chromate transporter n=1 Tax=Halomonas TaxID=2745 RepID=UPI001C95B84D|nr:MULTISPECIES: chromate transporter [Halomonas]MED5296215.1 chromate transporter [Pseudomonadota bacterium]MBY5969229.1 chromate transporter [Halomonas denitrificans]MBY5984859.1 chromate transporter [Halomonas sp. DP5Y7-2]MBY6030546.1 chromate transporter [Halomonas sp. DP8Y7-1]MBY6207905.1 chromate transporter [Halomonas sp. DP3Y7-2]